MKNFQSFWQQHRWIVGIVVGFVVLGAIYSMAVPMWEAPDESGHFPYVLYLIRHRRLPDQRFTETTVGEGFQAPLYYLLGAVATCWVNADDLALVQRSNPTFIWSGRGDDVNAALHGSIETFPYRGASLSMHLVRFLSVLMGAVTVVSTFGIARTLFPERRKVAIGAALINAAIPQFLFLSGVVNNDNLLIALSALAVWTMVKILQEGNTHRRSLVLGTLLGLALISKSSALQLLPLAGFSLWFARDRRTVRAFLTNLVWMLVPTLVVSGWWFARNGMLYGDPLGLRLFLETHPSFTGSDFTQWETWRLFLQKMHTSFWAQFGWMNLLAEPIVYRLLRGWYVLVLAGLAVWGVCYVRTRETKPRSVTWMLLLLSIVAAWAWVIRYSITLGGFGWQGRYLFPALPAFSVLSALGLSSLAPRRWRWIVLGAIVAALAVLAIVGPWRYIVPAYARPTLSRWQEALIPHRQRAVFGDEFDLLGYEVEPQVASPGETINLTLYWRARTVPSNDYTVFVHLVDERGITYGQHDSPPREGSLPTTAWWHGDIVRDVHPVALAPDAPPGDYTFRVGWYFWATGERIPVREGGEQENDFVSLSKAVIKQIDTDRHR